ncbi:MAG: YihA family ribosome biogenesis GTP-binding protein [Clostridia bacterium]|nr:YihA family ribosome biogenesis GTP-binding protein [Clostridia bacterium]
MKANIVRTTLSITAGLASQFPKDNRPQIALSGRSNVGKSSLINTVIGRKSYARVSQSPGKTITINFYDVDGQFYLVDLPGYGFAKRTEAEKRKWSNLTDSYFTQKNSSVTAVAQLVDLKVGLTKDDEMMLNFLMEADIPHFIVATKADKPNKTDRNKMLERLITSPYTQKAEGIVLFSSLTGEGKDGVLQLIFEAAERA